MSARSRLLINASVHLQQAGSSLVALSADLMKSEGDCYYGPSEVWLTSSRAELAKIREALSAVDSYLDVCDVEVARLKAAQMPRRPKARAARK